ncbi:MAG: DUF523 domain-containing protein [Candidatus Woesearchaeota archaeon]
MKIVSACLIGEKCRYNGTSASCKKVITFIQKDETISVCPELLGGLSIPRSPAERKGNKIITKDNIDVTAQFKKGAKKALKIALDNKCDLAILKSNSPSCGCGQVFDGTFSDKLINGDGEFTKLLKKHNIKVITEKDI